MKPNRPLFEIQPYTPIHVQKKFIGGFIKKLGNWFFGPATTRVKKFLEKHGNDKITSLELGRTPISSMLDKTINLISGGSFNLVPNTSGWYTTNGGTTWTSYQGNVNNGAAKFQMIVTTTKSW